MKLTLFHVIKDLLDVDTATDSGERHVQKARLRVDNEMSLLGHKAPLPPLRCCTLASPCTIHIIVKANIIATVVAPNPCVHLSTSVVSHRVGEGGGSRIQG